MINLPTYTEEVVIFGCKDSLAGRVFNMLCQYTNYEVKFFISVNELPEINIEKENRRRPNSKTEFAKGGTIFKVSFLRNKKT